MRNDEFINVIKNTGRTGMGWLNRVSIQSNLSQHFSIGLEGFIMLQTWSPKQGEFIQRSLNGFDDVSAMPDDERIFTYPESFSNVPVNPHVFASAFTYPLHACGATFRIGYAF